MVSFRALTAVNAHKIGTIGPALFAVICIAVVVLGLCIISSFIDRKKPRRTLRLVAFVLIVIPTIYFSSVSYISDTSQIVSGKSDTTYISRVLMIIFVSIIVVVGIVSFVIGEKSYLMMQRQGHPVRTARGVM